MTSRYQVPVEAAHLLQFARAVGNLEATYEEDAVAPPTFLMAADHFDPEYTRRPRANRPWLTEPSLLPVDGSAGFHAEQTFEYHRHPRAGDVLTAAVRPGRTGERQGRRGGRRRR